MPLVVLAEAHYCEMEFEKEKKKRVRRTGESTARSMPGNAATSGNFLTASHKISAHTK